MVARLRDSGNLSHRLRAAAQSTYGNCAGGKEEAGKLKTPVTAGGRARVTIPPARKAQLMGVVRWGLVRPCGVPECGHWPRSGLLCGSLVFVDEAAGDGPALNPLLGEVGDKVVGPGPVKLAAVRARASGRDLDCFDTDAGQDCVEGLGEPPARSRTVASIVDAWVCRNVCRGRPSRAGVGDWRGAARRPRAAARAVRLFGGR
jgi:hypothetical protein